LNFDRGELELVELGTFPDPQQAQMIQELLQNNGIVSSLRSDANAGVAFGAIPNRLLVSAADFQKARELFEVYFEGDQLGCKVEPKPADQCEVDPDVSN
jgi:hypothetical protein